MMHGPGKLTSRGGSIRFIAAQGTSVPYGFGQMRPILPVTGEELDIGTPMERMSGIQDSCGKYGRAIGVSSLFQEPAHRKIPTQDRQAAFAHLEDHSQVGDGPRPPTNDGEQIELEGRQDNTWQPVRAECGTEGFNACNGARGHKKADCRGSSACYDLKSI